MFPTWTFLLRVAYLKLKHYIKFFFYKYKGEPFLSIPFANVLVT